MEIHHELLTDVARYIENHKHITLEAEEATFDRYIRPIRQHMTVDENTRMLEIGTGIGSFPLLCKSKGLRCKGIEISPQLIEYARELGKRYGLEPDIELGNLEDADIGRNLYDVVIASNVFEHVEHWQSGVRKIYGALKPGGVMFFESTNKFSFTSGEYSFPLYGWLPNSLRYKLRIARQGPDIMKLGIDFHQFTHSGLRRQFVRCGFSRILDRVDIADEQFVSAGWKRGVVRVAKGMPPARLLALLFSDATRFLCFK